MRDTFHQQLDQLSDHVVEMAKLARGMLEDGVRSFVDLHVGLARAAMDRSGTLARLDDDIEQEALLLLTRQQPMARDMRTVAAALKLITYINRVGRYGRDIAQITVEWNRPHHTALVARIREVGPHVLRMFDLVVKAYETRSALDVAQLTAWENELDRARWDIFRAALDVMVRDPKAVEAGAHYMMVARYLERTGDNTCKMAEKVHYMLVGERIEIR